MLGTALADAARMRARFLTSVLLVFNTGCATTTHTYVTRSITQEEVVLASPHGLPAAVGDFSHEQGIVKGHVAWTYDCRRALVSKQITDTVETKTPNRAAAAGAIAVGAFIGLLSGALISDADTFSDVDECSTDSEGNYRCASPRDNAYALGAVGMLTAAVTLGTGVGTFAMKTRSHVTGSEPAPPVVSRVIKENVACGSRPVQNLGLALVRSNARLAFAATNSMGDVAFAIPPNLTGNLMVVVDSVPPPIAAIHVGDIVGSVEVRPEGTNTAGVETIELSTEQK